MLHPDKKFHSADEFREHFDKCVRYEIHGPIKSTFGCKAKAS